MNTEDKRILDKIDGAVHKLLATITYKIWFSAFRWDDGCDNPYVHDIQNGELLAHWNANIDRGYEGYKHETSNPLFDGVFDIRLTDKSGAWELSTEMQAVGGDSSNYHDIISMSIMDFTGSIVDFQSDLINQKAE